MQIYSNANNIFMRIVNYIKPFFFWLFFGAVTGAIGGVLGSVFVKSISFVTQLRAQHDWLIYLLPVGGLLSVAVYKLCKATDIGTNRVIESVKTTKTVPVLLHPAVFIGSVITHLFGGSAGKEGAALQLGGSIAAFIAKIFKFSEDSRHKLTVCGMSALFSAAFGTPLGACVFVIEVVQIGHIHASTLFASLVSSISAYLVSIALGVPPEKFELHFVSELNLSVLWRMAVIVAAVAAVGILFCHALHLSEKLFHKCFKNPYIRIFAGGVIIVLLTLLVGTRDYNGSGIGIIEGIFSGREVRPEAFLLKIIFTVITVGAGYKGGEIVPSFFIGASLGCTLAGVVGLTPEFGAAVGMAAIFSSVTNCPLATCLLCAEMFGAEGIIFFGIAAFAGYFFSSNTSLYTEQKGFLKGLV